eukprot:TRINITY_DN6817_c0_g1_i1.p1 TRINITY_DN6817_c0_g1~~TRINITY_DN6817_c0_g1_i1.p1  ORF type:complete len:523 (+),score=54.12 TRINITY_DN6817_c0_g1_i1:663-2231(+)
MVPPAGPCAPIEPCSPCLPVAPSPCAPLPGSPSVPGPCEPMPYGGPSFTTPAVSSAFPSFTGATTFPSVFGGPTAPIPSGMPPHPYGPESAGNPCAVPLAMSLPVTFGPTPTPFPPQSQFQTPSAPSFTCDADSGASGDSLTFTIPPSVHVSYEPVPGLEGHAANFMIPPPNILPLQVPLPAPYANTITPNAQFTTAGLPPFDFSQSVPSASPRFDASPALCGPCVPIATPASPSFTFPGATPLMAPNLPSPMGFPPNGFPGVPGYAGPIPPAAPAPVFPISNGVFAAPAAAPAPFPVQVRAAPVVAPSPVVGITFPTLPPQPGAPRSPAAIPPAANIAPPQPVIADSYQSLSADDLPKTIPYMHLQPSPGGTTTNPGDSILDATASETPDSTFIFPGESLGIDAPILSGNEEAMWHESRQETREDDWPALISTGPKLCCGPPGSPVGTNTSPKFLTGRISVRNAEEAAALDAKDGIIDGRFFDTDIVIEGKGIYARPPTCLGHESHPCSLSMLLWLRSPGF